MKKTIIAGLAIAGLAFTGCSKYNDARGRGDAPVGGVHEQARQVWENLDQFPNISAFCIGSNGVYTTTREGVALVIVQDDANCAEGGILHD